MIELVSWQIIPENKELDIPETLTAIIKVNGKNWSVGGLSPELTMSEIQQALNNKEESILADMGNHVDEGEIKIFSPQKESYKLSQLYGLTHEQLDTYIDNNVTNLGEAREFMRKIAHVILWLVKQTKLDE